MAKNAESNAGKWMALTAALLGWLFDGFEMGLFPLAGKPALNELLGVDGQGKVDFWFGIIIAVFLIGAASGGVLFGWMGDKFGRVKAMAISIGAYSIFSGLCAFATESWHVAVLRFLASLGMGGEWSLGVALVNEVWPGKSRAFLAGLIGAASNVGFMLVGIVGKLIEPFHSLCSAIMPEAFVTRLFTNDAWRFLMAIGMVPSLLVFLVLLWVPESKKWQEEKDKGGTGHWAKADLIGILVGCVSSLAIIVLWVPGLLSEKLGISDNVVKLLQAVGTIAGLGIALLAYLYPVKSYLRRAIAAGGFKGGSSKDSIKLMMLGAVLAGVALLGTWGVLQWATKWAFEMSGASAAQDTQILLAIGAIVGTIVATLLAEKFGRRATYFALCVGSLVAAFGFFQQGRVYDIQFQVWAFLAGAIMASFYGFFPFYFPELFPTAIRATGQGFAFNFGRVLAAIGGLQTAALTAHFEGNFAKAATTMSAVYLIGMVVIWFCPETKGKELPE
jgi:MFS transporter, SHS family, sialic acid transporter